MKHYEGMIILHNRELPEEEAAVEPEAYAKALIEKCGGTVAHIVPWANRKLAYPIAGNQTGNFLLAYFSSEGDINAKLQREGKIADRVLRVLTFSIPELPSGDDVPGPLTEPGARPADAPTAEMPPEVEQSSDPKDVAERKAKARAEKAEAERIDYKNVYHLRRMITSQGKLFSRVRSNLDAKNQRKLRQAVFRARCCALLPFVGR